MAEEPITAPPEDEPNPYAPPQLDFSDRAGIVDPEVEATRRAHLKDESYVKALTIVNLVYAVGLGAYVINRADSDLTLKRPNTLAVDRTTGPSRGAARRHCHADLRARRCLRLFHA